MAEGELPRRTVSSATRLTPEEIVNRGFASSFRGVSETEVRNFLRRIAEEFTNLRQREADLAARVGQLEDRLRNPPPPTEQQLLDSLGEETARVLRSAQEAAEDIRRKADERAGALAQESQDEARRLRETTEALCVQMRREAEAAVTARHSEVETAVAEMRSEAQRETELLREQAARDAEATREAARAEGRERVAEARAVRERILAEMSRRRGLLQAQLDELRSGRERLLDAYRVVKRTFTEATDALTHADAASPSAGEASLPASDEPPVPVDVADDGAPVVEEIAVVEEVRVEEVRIEVVEEPAPAAVEPASEPVDTETREALEHADEAPRARDVDALFAKLRAGREQAVDQARTVLETAPDVQVNGNGQAEPAESTEPAATAAEPEGGNDEGVDAPLSGDAAIVGARDAALERVFRDLVRRSKRALQDEQNQLLDVLRTHKGTTAPDKVLPGLDDQLTAWSEVVRPAVDAAYASAASHASGSDGASAAPLDLVDVAVRDLVLPLRERVYDGLATAGESEDDDVAQRVNARYREWKATLDGAVGDVLTAAWARGTLDAAPDGALLRWVPEREGRCADCDDNALEPTRKGESFPTGQPHPPAHPGCRCVLAVVAPEPAIDT
jgi:DivIVA domain-containing protein